MDRTVQVSTQFTSDPDQIKLRSCQDNYSSWEVQCKLLFVKDYLQYMTRHVQIEDKVQLGKCNNTIQPTVYKIPLFFCQLQW